MTRAGLARRMAVILAGVALGVACDGAARQESVEFRVPVTPGDVKSGTVEDVIVATGTLRATETATLTVETTGILTLARAAGRRLAEGDVVRKGQIIAEVAGEDVALAARTDATRQRYETAVKDLASKKKLFQEGFITEFELRQAESTLAETKNEYERSKLTESRTRIVTPIGGVIQRLARDAQNQPIADGQRVYAGATIAQIAPSTPLIADIDLVGPDGVRALAGMPAHVRYHALGAATFDGKLLRLAPSIDTATRAVRAEVEVQNPEGRLRPGMFVEVRLIAARHENTPVVPRDAVTERNNKKVVFVIKEQKVERREVVLGLGDDEIVEITSGLAVGERVAVKGIETLSDGTLVRVSG